MQGIEVTLKRNKQYVAENKEEYEVISGENNATTILVHFPEEYKDFSKRVDFKNIKNEKWSIGLYTPEDETKNYGSDFDKLNFAFTLPTPVTVNGELQIQFIAYLADDTETFVPFKLFKVIVEDSIMYVKKQGSENPDIILQAYEYANMALEISRDAFNRIENAERAALEAEKNAKTAQTSASSAQSCAASAKNSATSANTRAANAEASANAAEASAEYAEQVADQANIKSDNAVATSNSANTKADNAVIAAKEAKTSATSAVSTANTANTKSDNAVSVANTANTKSNNAVDTANEAMEIAEEALSQVVEKMGTKVYLGSNTIPETNLNFSSNPQTQITENKTLSDYNKTRLDGHDTEITNIKNNTTVIANSSGGFSCGSGATNGTGLQFKGFTICDSNGKVPVARLLDAIYPVGSIYFSTSSTNPGTLFGGTWEAFATGRTIIGIGTSDQTFSAGSTGGSSTHTLTIEQMPSHTHTQNSHSHKFNKAVQNEWSGNVVSGYTANARYLGWVEQGNGGGDNYQYTSGKGIYASYPETATNNNTGGGAAHNNLQPYIVTYIWKRTA